MWTSCIVDYVELSNRDIRRVNCVMVRGDPRCWEVVGITFRYESRHVIKL